MAVLTKEQWFFKLASFVPAWFTYEEATRARALLWGIARVLSEAGQKVSDHIDDTTISRCSSEGLAIHGAERSVERIRNESDSSYRERIRSLRSKANNADLKTLVDMVLLNGTCTIKNDMVDADFMNREVFMDRSFIFPPFLTWNTFTIIFKNQTPMPFSYANRDYFCDREDFMTATNGAEFIYTLISDIIESTRAVGTAYRVIELQEA